MMKHVINNLKFVMLFTICTVFIAANLPNNIKTVDYEVNKIYPYISLTAIQLSEACSIADLNANFKSSWISEYKTVELHTFSDGKAVITSASDDVLTPNQKNALLFADDDKQIMVKVKYMPANSMRHNDIKEFEFTINTIPDCEASFPGGMKAMNLYFAKNAINKIPNQSFTNYDIAIIKFVIDEKGKVNNISLYQKSKSTEIDEMLIQTVQQMPTWQPAEHNNGVKVAEEYVLTVGNMQNCIVNTLGIR